MREREGETGREREGRSGGVGERDRETHTERERTLSLSRFHSVSLPCNLISLVGPRKEKLLVSCVSRFFFVVVIRIQVRPSKLFTSWN